MRSADSVERRSGFALGLYTTLSGALMSLTPVALNFAIEVYSWRTAWILAGVGILVLVVPIARWGIISQPADAGQAPHGAAKDALETGTRRDPDVEYPGRGYAVDGLFRCYSEQSR